MTEYLYSLEQIIAVTGDAALADKMEQIAFNALPAALTKDMWARQYDGQPNQVLCTVAPRNWVSNGPQSNLFSLEGNFGCCTANLHQGWPKFAASLWMKSDNGDGLAAIAYAPCLVRAEFNGVPVTITEVTDYPFNGKISFVVGTETPVEFTLNLRIPSWVEGRAGVALNGSVIQINPTESFFPLRRVWENGDRVVLHLPLCPALRNQI